MEYYNPTTDKTFHTNANTRTQLKQGAWRWEVDGVPNSDHNPTHAQLIGGGYYKRVDATCNHETHKLVDGEVIDGDNISRKVVVALTPEDIADMATGRLDMLLAEVVATATDKVSWHIDPTEKAHWMGVADALSRKHNIWLAEITTAWFESRVADEVTSPPLTADEKQTWSNLAVIQGLTATIRDAAAAIADQLYTMAEAEILALPSDWVSTNILWA